MTFDDEAMIRDPSRWPGETLCLKKRPTRTEVDQGIGYSEFGVLTSLHIPIIVYLRENFKDKLEGRKQDYERTMQYASIEALLADGWMVD